MSTFEYFFPNAENFITLGVHIFIVYEQYMEWKWFSSFRQKIKNKKHTGIMIIIITRILEV